MATVMIHTPVNTRGHLIESLKKNSPRLEASIGEPLRVLNPHDYEERGDCMESWLLGALKDGELPDLFITHACEFSVLNDKEINSLLSEIDRNFIEAHSMLPEFRLPDENRIFFIYCIVPIVLCYNEKNVDPKSLGTSWEDIMEGELKMRGPSLEKPLSKTVGAYLFDLNPKKFKTFFPSAKWTSSPAEVAKSVARGESPLGVTTLSFASMLRAKGVGIHTPREGALMLPQMMCWKKGGKKGLLPVAEYLMSPEISGYLTSQGYRFGSRRTSELAVDTPPIHFAPWPGWREHLTTVRNFEKTFIKKEYA